MSRPGRDLSRKVLLRRARLRQLEAKSPPSMSLISNVKDFDANPPLTTMTPAAAVRLHPVDYANMRSISVDGAGEDGVRRCCGGAGGGTAVGGNSGGGGGGVGNSGLIVVRQELLAILGELRFITSKMKDDVRNNDETNDWKFAAMVIDRLCFWIFSAYLVLTTAVIFLSPHLSGR